MLHQCCIVTTHFAPFPKHVQIENISLQCFDTVGWATGRASGL